MPDHSSSRTTEHWFLDLDGVRSGPYQTPEVLSLVAEGEVMPHHRISTGLKDQPWITVLDWRLEQAKKSSTHEPEVKEVRSYIPASARPTPEPEPKIEIATEPEPEVAPASLQQAEPSADSFVVEEPALPPAPPPAPVPPPVSAAPAAPVIQHTPPHFPEPETAREIPTQTFDAPKEPRPKRDPMAEMFDVLQTSKQKREAKSQQIAQQQSHTHHHAVADEEEKSKGTSGLAKTVGIGIFITIIGFALGQIFQQSSPPSAPLAEKPTAASATPATKTEIIDRSTDKITIRGRVETVQKPNPTVTPLPTRPPQTLRPGTTAAAPSGGAHSEKELQELKDLKKELQELKALKEELKQGSGDSMSPEGASPEGGEEYPEATDVDTGFNYYPVSPGTTGPTSYPNNGYPQPAYPNNAPQNGQPLNNPNVHY